MGRGRVATNAQRIAIGAVVAAAAPENVSQLEVFTRAAEIARLTEIRWDRQIAYLLGLKESEDTRWGSQKLRLEFRRRVSPILALAMWEQGDTAWSLAMKQLPTSASGGRATEDATRDRTLEINRAVRLGSAGSLALASQFLSPDREGPEDIVKLLASGLIETTKQFLQGRLFTFKCSACQEIGFRIQRHGLRGEAQYCCVRCNRNPHPAKPRTGRPVTPWLEPWKPGWAPKLQ